MYRQTGDELVFREELWPDFTRAALEQSLANQRFKALIGRLVPRKPTPTSPGVACGAGSCWCRDCRD